MCGIIGVWNVERAAEVVYHGLHALQHRGKESAGISALTNDRRICSKRGEGIVNHVFSKEDLDKLSGSAAIGHVKQSHDSFASGVQPITAFTRHGEIAVAHNGLVTNRKALKEELMKNGSLFVTDSDCEIILHRFSRSNGQNIEDKIYETFNGVNPAYSIAMLTYNELVGIRDAFGVRPLEIGLLNNRFGESYAIASESVAFDRIGAEHIGEVKPGELVIADRKGLRRKQLFSACQRPCVLEPVYLGHPTSVQFGNCVNDDTIRKAIGRQLYLECPVNADVVSSIPDASNSMALGFHMESGIPLDLAIVRGHYIGRQFIDLERAQVGSRVLRKFSVNRDVVKDKRIVLVDDFILSGETLRDLSKMARGLGAREIHVRIAYPPYKNACYLGVSTAGERKLLANALPSVDEMRKFLGVNSLGFLSMEGLQSVPEIGRNYCTYCASGVEVVPR